MRFLAISFVLPPIASAAAVVVVALGGKGRVSSSTTSSSASTSSLISSISSSAPVAIPTPVVVNCTNTSRTPSPSCWDILEMDLWMFHWNKSTTTCSVGEIWSDCFLRLAFGAPGYDCSTVNSTFCTPASLRGTPSEPHAFYAAYNIYAVWQYFSTWEKALYAIKSQPAISKLVSILNVPGAPKLTVNSLLAAIIGNYGLNPAIDEAFIDILPSGLDYEKPLDTRQTYMSTQLAGLLGDVLMSLSTDFLNTYFLLMVQHGQMMTATTESLANLEAKLAGTYQNTQPITG